jgi:hypothetical protein
MIYDHASVSSPRLPHRQDSAGEEREHARESLIEPGNQPRCPGAVGAVLGAYCACSSRSSARMRARSGRIMSAVSSMPTPERKARPHPSALTSNPR